ncbi:MAG: RNA polymerase factor sigma-54 [Pseudomonadota bacterium]
MKIGLQMGLGQHLTMTPQLQQAIKLLQLSTLELQQEVQAALDSNPLLELDDGSDASSDPITQVNAGTPETADAAGQALDLDHQNDLPNELPVDTAWDDIYVGSSGSGGGDSLDEDGDPIESRNAPTETLQDHLRWQLNLTPFSDLDRLIADAIIDGLDARGYLTVSLEELAATAMHWRQQEAEEDEIIAVLHRVQHFDPPGVAARNLAECLLIQLGQRDVDTPGLADARLLLSEHCDRLANGDLAGLVRLSKLNEAAVHRALKLIRELTPHPGEGWTTVDDKALIPDVVVRKLHGRWRVELNPDAAPRLRVNSGYASMLRRADSTRDNQFIRDHLQEARWLIKSLQSRHETLLKVASCIVEHQRGFLDDGPIAMKPLILRDVADEVGLHESTISRVTTQKYLHTPRGLFELKYFFSSHVSTSSGGEASSTAIRAMIKQLVAAENQRKPLSDNKIADLLQAQGIEVARRTIAKYRESLNIASSSDRKRLL